MITIRKLATLPLATRNRKVARLIVSWERDGALPDSVYLSELARLLSGAAETGGGDESLIVKAASDLGELVNAPEARATCGDPALRRVLNNLRHALLAAEGVDQADWDLLPSGGEAAFPDRGSRSGSAPSVGVLAGVTLYLEDLRSPFNVGSIFRTAAAFGVGHVIVSPACADPRHRRAMRSAMGAIDTVSWSRGAQESGGADEASGRPLIALELGGTPVERFSFPHQGVLAIGSEELGLSPQLLAAADARVSIALSGTKASLNVGVAAAIALHAWRGALAPIE